MYLRFGTSTALFCSIYENGTNELGRYNFVLRDLAGCWISALSSSALGGCSIEATEVESCLPMPMQPESDAHGNSRRCQVRRGHARPISSLCSPLFWAMEDVLTQIDRAIQRGNSVSVIASEFRYAEAKATHNGVLAKLVRSFTLSWPKPGI